MAGTGEAISSNNIELEIPSHISPISALIDQWRIQYARFINYRSSSFKRTHPSLSPIRKNRSRPGTWISTDAASLQLLYQRSCSGSGGAVIVVSLPSKVLEEHYVSKMHFSWPQVSCVSGFPARGSRAVLVSYKDGDGQIQKFVLRFTTLVETEKLMNVVKELFLENGPPQQLPQSSEFNSQLSSQAEVIPSDGPSCRTEDDLCTTSIDKSSQPTLPISQLSATQESVPYKVIGNHDAIETETMSTFPPSFTQLVKDCQPAVPEAEPTKSGQDLKTQFMRYLEGTSFKELLATVESVVNELGDDIVL